MRELIVKILKEEVGVPSGVYESSVDLYLKINDSIQGLSDPLFPDDNDLETEHTYEVDFKIADFEINQITMKIRFIKHENVDEVTLVSMSYHHVSKIEDSMVKTIVEDGKVGLSIVILVPKDTTVSDVKEFFVKSRKEIVTSLTHELMHAYDSFKSKGMSLYSLTKYSGFKDISFRVKPVDEFLFLLYFTHGIENVVRPSELFSNMKENNISSEEFYDFITSTEIWKNLQKCQNWNYETFRENLKEYIPDIQRVLEKAGATIPHKEEELIDEFLRIVYINLINKQLSQVNRMLVSDFFEIIMGLSGDKEKLFKKIIKTANKFENNINNFYLYEQNNFKKVSREIMKKISKLYSLTNKQEKTSILDWDLHHEINKTSEKIDKDFKFKRPKKNGNL